MCARGGPRAVCGDTQDMNPSSCAHDATAYRAAQAFAFLLALALAMPSTAGAANGDCGQPQSSGELPNTSDALFVLQHAVGLPNRDCELCVCDVDSSGSSTATDALAVLRAAVFKDLGLLNCASCGTASSSTSTTSSTSTSSSSSSSTSSTTTTTTTTLDALTWDEIRQVFAGSCAGADCHTSDGSSGGLSDLDNFDAGHANLVNADTACFNAAPNKRVVPGDPDASFLLNKLEGTQNCGSSMPFLAPQLSASIRTGIRNWILSGAPKNAR